MKKEQNIEEELNSLLDDPRTGLKLSSDTNKTRYAILDLINQARQQEQERIVMLIDEIESINIMGQAIINKVIDTIKEN